MLKRRSVPVGQICVPKGKKDRALKLVRFLPHKWCPGRPGRCLRSHMPNPPSRDLVQPTCRSLKFSYPRSSRQSRQASLAISSTAISVDCMMKPKNRLYVKYHITCALRNISKYFAQLNPCSSPFAPARKVQSQCARRTREGSSVCTTWENSAGFI